MRYATSLELIMLMLMVLVDYPCPTTVPLPENVLQTLQDTPVRADQIRQLTDTDPVLSRVRWNVLSGWVDLDEPELQPYQS